MKTQIMPKNHLPDNFYTFPNLAVTTMSKKDLQETLLATEGTVLALGRLYNIKSKSLGAGIYKISLKRFEV